MSATWEFAYLVPHAAFPDSVENDYLALVPSNDGRLQDLARTHPAVRQLCSSFTDQFGCDFAPSAILIRPDAPNTVDFYAVAAFRNAIAISSIIDGWTFRLGGGNANYPLWSDHFDFYPFTATPNGDELYGKSVANQELDKPDDFRGQRAPHLPSPDRLTFGTDRYVLAGLLRNWERRFVRKRMEWKTGVLFRSLEIACQASRLPAVGTRQPTIHDVGVGIALWVSAFEIISHPRTSDASRETVVRLLGQADWIEPKLKAKWYTLKNQHGRPLKDSSGRERRFSFIQKLYGELYRARNDFLHGNPVTAGNLFPSRIACGPTLLHCAPLVYRAALMPFLPFDLSDLNTGDLHTSTSAWLLYSLEQGHYEEAVESCRRRAIRR